MRKRLGARRFGVVATAGAAALVVATACWLRPERPLVVAFDESIMTLDPHLHNHAATWSVLINIYDGLVRFSPEMRLEPSLATSWEKLEPTRWRLRLRGGARFSDGSAFDAADVVASFERARTHPRSEVRHLIAGVRSVREDGTDAIVVETAEPLPDLLNRLAFLAVIPSEKAGETEITRPVGTGPYRFEERLENGDIRLVAWPSWRGRSPIREVRLCFLADANEAVRRLLSGSADVVRRPPDDMTREIEQNRSLRLVPQPRLGVQLLAVIPNAPAGAAGGALADPRVRRALLLALDREGWVSRIFRGNGTVASQYVHPVVFGYDPAIRPVPFDPHQARRLLAEAGFANGFSVKLAHVAARSSVVEAVQEDLSKVNIRVVGEGGSYAEALARVRTGQVDLFLYGWICSTGDASDFFNSSIHSRDAARGLGFENYSGFADPTTDRILEEADRELVPERRLQLLQEAQRRTLDQLPVLPLTVRWGFMATSDRVEVRTRHDERIWLFDYRWRS